MDKYGTLLAAASASERDIVLGQAWSRCQKEWKKGDDLPPAWDEMYDAVREAPERAWQVILWIARNDQDDKVKANLAAGPMEDLLVYHGPRFIERVEHVAKVDPVFNDLLGGVWKNAMAEDVWARVEKARGQVW